MIPNLDDCDEGELDGHEKVFTELAHYCRLRTAAAAHRREGKIQKAQQQEACMQAIYVRLPDWAKW